MHTVIETIKLQNILDATSRITTKHLTLPILQCVLLEVKNTQLSIKATNLEVGIESVIKTKKTETDGVVAVPAQTLLQTINLIQHPEFTLTTQGDVLLVETKTSRTNIKTVPIGEFPHIPHIKGGTFDITGTVFAHGIKTTALTASQSSIKPELGSVYIHQKKEHALTFVATDSFRLMEKTVPQKNLTLDNPILIPYKNALELARIAETAEGTITVHVGENQCAINVGDTYITSRLISGTFPDYEQIIPKEYVTTATLLTKDLAHALKKTNIFLNKFMQLTLSITKKGITLSSQSGDAGTTTEEVNANIEGNDLTLNFNQRYVADVLTHLTDDSVRLKCAGMGRPMVIENMHDRSLRYLVMPMNK